MHIGCLGSGASQGEAKHLFGAAELQTLFHESSQAALTPLSEQEMTRTSGAWLGRGVVATRPAGLADPAWLQHTRRAGLADLVWRQHTRFFEQQRLIYGTKR